MLLLKGVGRNIFELLNQKYAAAFTARMRFNDESLVFEVHNLL
jgi:hypothetical protein